MTPGQFRFDTAPFDRLDPTEREQFLAALDIAYHPAGEVLIEAGEAPLHLYILIRGLVREQCNAETACLYGPGDHFDALGLMQSRSDGRFVAEQDVVSYMLPRKMFRTLLLKNEALARYFQQDLSDKIRHQGQRPECVSMAPLLATPLREAYLQPVSIVAADTPLREAAVLMRSRLTNTLLVDTSDGFRLLTSSRLRDNVLIERQAIDSPVRAATSIVPVCIDADEPLSQAILAMAEHQIKRLIVTDEGDPIGILDVTDLFSQLSNPAYLLFVQIARASSASELAAVATRIPVLIDRLHDNGTRIEHINRLVWETYRGLLRRMFDLVFPQFLRSKCCLVALGHVGREEPATGIEQSNALVVADPADLSLARHHGVRLAAAIRDCRFAPGPADMTLANEEWVQCTDQYRTTLDGADSARRAENIALWADAGYLAGQKNLLQELQDAAMRAAERDRPDLQVDPADRTGTPGGLAKSLLEFASSPSRSMDLRRLGLEPVVRLARDLALRHGIGERNTCRRLAALGEAGILNPDFTAELVNAYEYLAGLCAKPGSCTVTAPVGASMLRTGSLDRIQFDLLQRSLQVIGSFPDQVTVPPGPAGA